MDAECCQKCIRSEELAEAESLLMNETSHRRHTQLARKVRRLKRFCRASSCGFYTRLTALLLSILLLLCFLWSTYTIARTADKGPLGSSFHDEAGTVQSRVRREDDKPDWLLRLIDQGEHMYEIMDIEALDVMNAIDLATATDQSALNSTRAKRTISRRGTFSEPLRARTAALKMPYEKGKALHFRRIGELAGTASVAHLIMRLDFNVLHQHGNRICDMHSQLQLFTKEGTIPSNTGTSEERRLAQTLDRFQKLFSLRCQGVQQELSVRQRIWRSEFERDVKFNVDKDHDLRNLFTTERTNVTATITPESSVVREDQDREAEDYDSILREDGHDRGRREAVLAALDLPTWVVDRHRADLPPHNLRQKRQIVTGILALIGVISSVSTFYSASQLHEIGSNSQKKNVAILQDHEERVSIDEKAITILNDTVNILAKHEDALAHRIYALEKLVSMSLAIDASMDDMHRITRGLNALANRRLSPDLVTETTLRDTVDRLKRQLKQNDFELGIESIQSVFSCETSHLAYENNTLLIITHIPAFKVGSKMDLFELISLPVMLEMDQYSPLKKAKGTAEVFLKPQPKKNIIAVQPTSNMVRALSRPDLDECQEMNLVYFCPTLNIYHREDEFECVVGLYTKHDKVIQEHCPWTVHPAEDAAIQLDSNNFIVYQHKTSEVQYKCGKAIRNKPMRGLYEFFVAPGCTLTTDKFVIHGQMDFALTAPVVISHEWAINNMDFGDDFPFESFANSVQDKTSEVGTSKGLTIRDLKDEYNKSWWNQVSKVGSSTGFGLLTLGLILLLAYLCVRHSRKKSVQLPQPLSMLNLQRREDLRDEHEALRASENRLRDSEERHRREVEEWQEKQRDREKALAEERQQLLAQESVLMEKLRKAPRVDGAAAAGNVGEGSPRGRRRRRESDDT